MKKRNLYDEINAGLHHLEQARLGNATVHSVKLEMKAAVTVDAKEVKAIREQARGQQDAEAALLIHSAERFPDTVKKLYLFKS